MKNIGKAVLSSVTAIVLSASLIAGSTFALFSSESKTDIAITAGHVSVKATAKITEVYSAKWSGDDYIDDPQFEGDGAEGESYSFSNGGTAMYSGGTLTLNNISPGDGVKFSIDVENTSSISIKYQTVVTLVGDSENPAGEELYKALNITVEGAKGMENISSDRTTAVSEWSEAIAPSTDIGPIGVNIKLPWGAGDALQEAHCEVIIGVYAVQSNGHDETKKDVYFVNSHSDVQEVLDNMEDGGILAAGEKVTFTDESPLTVPENKDITLDVNGNDVNVDKQIGKGDGVAADSLVVPEGSSLTVTNSAEGGSFNLNANADVENWSSGSSGTYTLKVEEGGTLNLEDVHCAFSNVEAKKGNHIVYVGGGTVNCNAGTDIDFEGKDFASGFLVREGGTMNVTGTKFHSTGAVGQITVGYSSYAEGESTVNINAGTEIVYENADSLAGAIVVNQTGNVNIHEGSSITVGGNTPDAAAAIRVVGGGNVVMDGGTINLETTMQNGWAYAVFVFNNTYGDPAVADGKYAAGQEVNAHIEFKGSAKILVNNHAIVFAAQKNYRIIYAVGSDGIPDPELNGWKGDFLKDDGGNPIPTIIVRNGVAILFEGTEVKTNDAVFSQGSAGNTGFGAYTPDAIADERNFEQPM